MISVPYTIKVWRKISVTRRGDEHISAVSKHKLFNVLTVTTCTVIIHNFIRRNTWYLGTKIYGCSFEKTFIILTHCDGEAASYAFDEYGHGALVVDEEIQYAQDMDAAVSAAVKAMKQWVTVL